MWKILPCHPIQFYEFQIYKHSCQNSHRDSPLALPSTSDPRPHIIYEILSARGSPKLRLYAVEHTPVFLRSCEGSTQTNETVRCTRVDARSLSPFLLSSRTPVRTCALSKNNPNSIPYSRLCNVARAIHNIIRQVRRTCASPRTPPSKSLSLFPKSHQRVHTGG